MNAVVTAMKKAKVALPLNKRVWNWVKDHPNSSATQIAKGINAPASGVSSVLSQMNERKMVERRESPSNGQGSRGGAVLTYTTPVRMKEFELHSLPKKTKKAPAAPAVPEDRVEAALQAMNVTEAHAMYLRLKQMFTQ